MDARGDRVRDARGRSCRHTSTRARIDENASARSTHRARAGDVDRSIERDDEEERDADDDEDELRDVSPSEAYGFAGMVLTTLAFALWLFAVFASEDALERVGAPSGKAARHYARALPMWLIAACVYAFLGYECLNLMSTPDDFSRRFDAVTPDASEYAVDDPDLATRTFPLYAMDSEIPLFRDICRYEVTRRQFPRDETATAKAKAKTGEAEKTTTTTTTTTVKGGRRRTRTR